MVQPADLVCKDITKDFNDFRAVDHVNFEVPQGSFFSILKQAPRLNGFPAFGFVPNDEHWTKCRLWPASARCRCR